MVNCKVDRTRSAVYTNTPKPYQSSCFRVWMDFDPSSGINQPAAVYCDPNKCFWGCRISFIGSQPANLDNKGKNQSITSPTLKNAVISGWDPYRAGGPMHIQVSMTALPQRANCKGWCSHYV